MDKTLALSPGTGIPFLFNSLANHLNFDCCGRIEFSGFSIRKVPEAHIASKAKSAHLLDGEGHPERKNVRGFNQLELKNNFDLIPYPSSPPCDLMSTLKGISQFPRALASPCPRFPHLW